MKNKFEQVDQTFVVLYNAGDGELHEVQLNYDQQMILGRLLMKMHKDNIQVDQDIYIKKPVKKFTIPIKEEDNSEQE